MTELKRPIPRPLRQRLGDLRVRFVPVLVYVVGICVSAWLWNKHWMPGTFSGEVQAVTANVASPRDGELVRLSVAPFDRVTKGQVIGEVTVSATEVAAGLEVVRAELEIMRERLRQDQRRNSLNYQQLLVERVDQQTSLDAAHFDLSYVESDLVRTQQLRSDDYINRLASQVRQREALIEQLDQALSGLGSEAGGEGEPNISATIDAAIQAEKDQILNTTVSVLRAPIDGVVTDVSRLEGENVSQGEVLVSISSEQPERIVGFIRQPASVEPSVGDVVVVRSRRGNDRLAAEASVLAIGARLELFTRPLRVRGFDNSQERGLPVLISVPEELALYPGEIVDLTLK